MLIFFLFFLNAAFSLEWSSSVDTLFIAEGIEATLSSITCHPEEEMYGVSWIQTEEGTSHIETRIYQESWQDPIIIGNAEEEISTIALHCDTTGRITALWDAFSSSEYSLQSAFYQDEQWSSATCVEILSDAIYPSGVSLQGTNFGDCVAAWYTPEERWMAKNCLQGTSTWSMAYSLLPSSVSLDPCYFYPFCLDDDGNLSAFFFSSSKLYYTCFPYTEPSGAQTEALIAEGPFSPLSPIATFQEKNAYAVVGLQLQDTFSSLVAADNFPVKKGIHWNLSAIAFPSEEIADFALAIGPSNPIRGAIWQTQTGKIQASICVNQNWSNPVLLASEGSLPVAAFDPTTNHFWVAWVQPQEDGETSTVQMTQFDLHSWQAPQTISLPGSSFHRLCLEINGNGKGLLVWDRDTDGEQSIEALRSTSSSFFSQSETMGPSLSSSDEGSATSTIIEKREGKKQEAM